MSVIGWIVAVILFFWVGVPLIRVALELLVVSVISLVKFFRYVNRPRD